MKPVIVSYDLVTAYGRGIDALWTGLSSGRTTIAPLTRFTTDTFTCRNAACLQSLRPHPSHSLFQQMLTSLIRTHRDSFPSDVQVILSTTAGEIDLLEKAVLEPGPKPEKSSLRETLRWIAHLVPSRAAPMAISAACASSTVALATAASMIQAGDSEVVLVIAGDCVTEFVYSGFSALMALDPGTARPFDSERHGLSLGEGAAFALVMSEARAMAERRPILGEIAGHGITNDANHMTGPSRDGQGLARAITKTLANARLCASAIESISAHGTGTAYNDSMEMKAFQSVFRNGPIPTYSIKGAIGHTLGAAGLIETLLALKSLDMEAVPPTVGLRTPASDAAGWVTPGPVKVPGMRVTLTTNSGFGGINAALVLRKPGAPDIPRARGRTRKGSPR